MILIEDLQLSNMSKSAKGTVEIKGRNVKQKLGLNRFSLDQGWLSSGDSSNTNRLELAVV